MPGEPGSTPAAASDKVADVVAEWLESNPRKKGSSLARDRSITSVHILPLLGKYPIGDVTPADVQRLVNTWSTRLGARSVRRQYAVLCAVMTFALDTDRIVRSPCRRIRLPEPEAVRQMAVTPEQLHGLADAVGADTSGMVYLAAVLGLRWGECAGLRVGAIDFLNRTVTVESQLTRGLKGQMVTGSPKWNSTRTMAAPELLLEQLATHLRRRGITGAEGESLVFCAPGWPAPPLRELAPSRLGAGVPASGAGGFPVQDAAHRQCHGDGGARRRREDRADPSGPSPGDNDARHLRAADGGGRPRSGGGSRSPLPRQRAGR